MSTVDADILATLRRVEMLLHRLPAAVAAEVVRAQQPASVAPLAAHDLELIAGLLPRLAEWLGKRGRVFSTADAIEFLELQQPASLTALKRGLGEKNFARRLGRLLARAASHDVGGLVIERVRDDRSGVVWGLRSSAIETRIDAAKPANALLRRAGNA